MVETNGSEESGLWNLTSFCSFPSGVGIGILRGLDLQWILFDDKCKSSTSFSYVNECKC